MPWLWMFLLLSAEYLSAFNLFSLFSVVPYGVWLSDKIYVNAQLGFPSSKLQKPKTNKQNYRTFKFKIIEMKWVSNITTNNT